MMGNEDTLVVTIGEILVEIMATQKGEGFLEPLNLRGPFPSGAPAIFINQCALLGQRAGIIATVGDDDFGQFCLSRLRENGADISAIAIDSNRPTGTAFVRYREDGNRDFVFNITHAASGQIPYNNSTQALLDKAGHLHVMGSSLSDATTATLVLDAAKAIKSRGGSLSFDPNLRKELTRDKAIRPRLEAVLDLTDLFMPSGEELHYVVDSHGDEARAIAALQTRGISDIVIKRGAKGASWYQGNVRADAAPLTVDEIDPTGAGDCFGAAAVSFWLQGLSPKDSLHRANIIGAHAVTKLGPMEGSLSRAALEASLKS